MSGIPVLNIVKYLLPSRKKKDKKLVARYQQLHQDFELEIKSKTIIRKYGGDLKKIINKRQPPSKTKRDKGLA